MFPRAAITNDHRRDKTAEMSFLTVLEAGSPRSGLGLSGGSGDGRFLALVLVQGWAVFGIPWLGDAFLQSLPLSPRGLALCVISVSVCAVC